MFTIILFHNLLSSHRIHAFAIANSADYYHDHVDAELKTLGLDIRSRDVLRMVDDYVGRGYRIANDGDVGEFWWKV